jgi:phosphoribosyl-ATP pyrophosphohydrolase
VASWIVSPSPLRRTFPAHYGDLEDALFDADKLRSVPALRIYEEAVAEYPINREWQAHTRLASASSQLMYCTTIVLQTATVSHVSTERAENHPSP